MDRDFFIASIVFGVALGAAFCGLILASIR